MSYSVSTLPEHVAIAGAGMAGLAAAILLARHGMAVTLFDQVPDPTPVGAGLLLQPSGQAVLERLGLLAAVREQAAPVASLQGFVEDRRVLDLHYQHLNPDWHGLGIHRASLHRVLWQAAQAAGVRFELGRAVTEFFTLPHCVLVQHRVTGGPLQQDDFSALIIANGTRSQLRTSLPVRLSHQPYPWGAYWAVLERDDWPFPDVLMQRYRGAHIMLGILPSGRHPQTGRTCYSLFWSVPRRKFTDFRRQGLDGLLAAVKPVWPEVAEWLSAANPEIAIAEYADVRLSPWQHQRVVVIGDAAHAMSPQLGQGANMALIDAWILVQEMTHPSAPGGIPAALQRYSKRRAAHIAYYQMTSRIMTPLYQSHWPLGWLRDAGTRLGRNIGPVYRQYLHTLCGAKQGNFDFRASIDDLLDRPGLY